MSEVGKKVSGRVWDPLVRLFHWALVAAFATAWFIRSEAAIHETAGKIVLVLVILRAAWGVVGTGSARFETFIKGPIATLRYVISILRGKPTHYLGHNPAGAVMIGALLLSLTATTASGVLMTTTAFWGSTWTEWVHGTAATLTVFLIAGHLLGVIAACLQHRENLPWSMVTGRKWVSVNTERFLGPTMFTRKRNLAALALIATGFGVWSASGAVFNAGFWRMPKIIKAEVSKGSCEVEAVSGPQIMVYPAMQMEYDVTFAEGAGSGTAVVPTGLALQKRPQIDVSEVVQDCKTAFEAKSKTRFGFADSVFASFMSVVDAAKTTAANGVAESQTSAVRQIGLSSTPAPGSNAAEAVAAAPPGAGDPLPDTAGAAPTGGRDTDSDVSAANSTGGDIKVPDAAAAPAQQDGSEVLRSTIAKPKLKTTAAKPKADISKKAAPTRAKVPKSAVKKSKSKAAAAKPLSNKAIRKLLKRKKKSAWRAPAGRSSSGSNSSSGSGISGSDDDNDDNSGSGSNNSGSGNSGSGSSGSGSNSGSGGGGGDD